MTIISVINTILQSISCAYNWDYKVRKGPQSKNYDNSIFMIGKTYLEKHSKYIIKKKSHFDFSSDVNIKSRIKSSTHT